MSQLPLFTFGSLMDADVLELVADLPHTQLTATEAIVKGFSQREVREENYPVLIKEPASQVAGLLIRGLTDLARARILFFEGDEYVLDELSVIDAHGNTTKAQYFRHNDVYSVLPTPWDFSLWQQQHKTHFLQQTAGYMKLFGTMNATDADAHWQQLGEK